MSDWRFFKGHMENPAAPNVDDSVWEIVSLPHTWNVGDGSDGRGYYRGEAWYRRHLLVPAEWKDKQVFIEFDGANRIAEVFLNGVRIGEHRGGYARFRFDLTETLSHQHDNILVVRVTNAEGDNLPPISADYTFFGGLYRGVRLIATDRVHIEMMDHGSPGVFIQQTNLTDIAAELSVKMKVANEGESSAKFLTRTEIVDAAGQIVGRLEKPVRLNPLQREVITGRVVISHPHRWNAKADPYLYRVNNYVIVGGVVRDLVSLPLGLRTFAVDPDRGFILNDRYLDLHGVSRHQERAGKGWAISPSDEREDFSIIEEMGCTVVRQSHYQQSQLWNDLADERGMIMWAEVAYTNDALDNPAFFESAKEQLRELIRQNAQHPAICFWSIGNETFVRNKKTIPLDTNDRLLRELAAVVRKEDPSRLSTYASNGDATEPRAGIPDAIGFNHYFGWYRDALEDLAPWLDRQRADRPDLRIGMSEFGAGANTTQHELTDKKPEANGRWHPEEWQAKFHEVYWQTMATRPWLWCKLVWCMFDFASDGRHEGGTPGINDKGLVTADRKIRKDAFYWYKANWNSEPMVYITSRRFAERTGETTNIKIYSNLPSVSLILNGSDLGTKSSDNHIFVWEQVSLRPGDNIIEAHAERDSVRLTDKVTWISHRRP